MAISKTFASLALAHPSRRWIAKIYALLLMRVAIVALVDGVRWWCCWLSAPRPPTESASEPSPRAAPLAHAAVDASRDVGAIATVLVATLARLLRLGSAVFAVHAVRTALGAIAVRAKDRAASATAATAVAALVTATATTAGATASHAERTRDEKTLDRGATRAPRAPLRPPSAPCRLRHHRVTHLKTRRARTACTSRRLVCVLSC
jgi:hypothetical protein